MGTALWLLGDEIAVWLLGLAAPPTRYPAKLHVHSRVLREPLSRQVAAALSTSAGFGGINAAPVFQRLETSIRASEHARR